VQGLLMTPHTLPRYASLFFAVIASGCSPSTDTVDMSTMQGNDSATVVLNGRRADCTPYEVTHGSPQAQVDNFLASRSCPSEVAVFAKGNAMGLRDTADTWTDNAGDVASVPMRGVHVLPLNILILSGDLANRSPAGRATEAQGNVTSATQLWDDNQCGISFSANYKDETQTRYDPRLLETTDCARDAAALKAIDPAFTASSGVNVFYYEGVVGTQGLTCADGNSAIILVSKWSGDSTLAHELGHALTLQHTNGMTDMPADDLMMSPTSYPASLTAGQCFRSNVETQSTLNTLGIRTDPTRACATANCPPLSIHK
jgi:hypothetical protein